MLLFLFLAGGALAGAFVGYFMGTSLDSLARPDFLVWVRDYSEDAWPWELAGAVAASAIAFAIGVTSDGA